MKKLIIGILATISVSSAVNLEFGAGYTYYNNALYKDDPSRHGINLGVALKSDDLLENKNLAHSIGLNVDFMQKNEGQDQMIGYVFGDYASYSLDYKLHYEINPKFATYGKLAYIGQWNDLPESSNSQVGHGSGFGGGIRYKLKSSDKLNIWLELNHTIYDMTTVTRDYELQSTQLRLVFTN